MSRRAWCGVTAVIVAVGFSGCGLGPRMNFFVTSAPTGDGGNLGGLAAADAHCRTLAAAAGSKRQQWRAYLSATADGEHAPVNARDRIGHGPWFNAKGVQVAASLDDLHGPGNQLGGRTSLDERETSCCRTSTTFSPGRKRTARSRPAMPRATTGRALPGTRWSDTATRSAASAASGRARGTPRTCRPDAPAPSCRSSGAERCCTALRSTDGLCSRISQPGGTRRRQYTGCEWRGICIERQRSAWLSECSWAI